MRYATRIALYAAALVVAAGAALAAAHGSRHGSAPAGVVSLDVHARGDVLDVLTGESGASKHVTLWHRQSRDGGKSWSAPSRVDAGMPPPRRPHRGDDAQIASDGRHIIAAWSTSGNGWLGTGRLITAYSADGGKTWQRGASPAGDERNDGQSYADIAARDGRFHLAWLDSRGGAQGVRYATSADGGSSWERNTALQPGSCECCWSTVVAGASRSVYTLFRARSPRDMAIAVSRDDGATWTRPARVGGFDWQIEACPHTGGALALAGRPGAESLHALVWTGKSGARGLHVFSTSAAAPEWKGSTRLGGEFAQRGDVAARDSDIVAVWDEPANRTGAVFMARSGNRGATWSRPVKLSAESANAVYPRVAAAREGFVVFWTETPAAGPGALRTVLVR